MATDSATATAATPAKSGFWAELDSLKTPASKDVAPAPKVGDQAPSSSQIKLPDGRKTIVLFLRHCGCPFAEKTFKALTAVSNTNTPVHCVGVSHSSAAATERWVPAVGGAWRADVVVDEGRDLYASWGLDISSAWHMLNPRALYSVYRLGTDHGIWNRPTESGSRWQTSGAFAVDETGIVRWAHVSSAADDMPDFDTALTALGEKPAVSPT